MLNEGIEDRTFRARLAAIVLFGFVVRVVYTMLWSRTSVLGFDGTSYYELAKSIASRGGYETSGVPHHATVLFPPGYPFFLAVGRLLGLGTRTKLLIWTSGLGSATVAMTGILGRTVATRRVGLIAAGVAAVYPNLWLADGALMTESLSAALVVAALLLTLRVRRTPTLINAFWLGAVLAWLVLTRSDGVLIALACAVVAGWTASMVTTPMTLGARLRIAVMVLIVPVVVLSGWQIRNQIRFHNFVPIAVNGWAVVAGANCHDTYYGSRIGSWEFPCVRLGDALTHGDHGEILQNRYARDVGMKYMRDHLSRLPVVTAARLGRTFGAYEPWHELEIESMYEGRSSAWSKVGYIMYLGLIPLAAIGAFRLRGSPSRALMVCVIPLAAVLISTMVGYGNQRFRSPLEPVIVVLAAVVLGSTRTVDGGGAA